VPAAKAEQVSTDMIRQRRDRPAEGCLGEIDGPAIHP
jgi:hypothetical protein